jgi:hypothetical protein
VKPAALCSAAFVTVEWSILAAEISRLLLRAATGRGLMKQAHFRTR